MTDKEELEKVFNDIDNEYKDLNEKLLNISKRKNQLNEDLLEYRIKSVKRVLSFIYFNSDISINPNYLKLLITHCVNKLNGNIDGVEIDLNSKELCAKETTK